MATVEMLLVAWAAVALLMLMLWLLHFPLRNAAIVDVGWTFGLGIVAWVFYFFGHRPSSPSLILAILVSLWALRLGGHLFKDRVWGQSEEGRYLELRRKWKSHLGFKFLLFFQFQALLDVLLALPILLVARNTAPSFSFFELFGIGLWVLAWIGEAFADHSLKKFKANPQNRGKTCREGLWRYSRHPNYFFEWMIWCAYFVYALGSPYGYLAIFSPMFMLYLLLKVTGIPATEAQALRSRGEEYRRYQETTSMFIPWPPKEAS